MALLSTLAIIATIFTCWLSALVLFDMAPDQYDVNTATTPSKRVWLKFLHLFNIKEAPLWRKVLLKILLSLFFITAVVCSFLCIFSELNTKTAMPWRIILAFLVEILSLGTIGFISYVILMPADILSRDYFGLYEDNSGKKRSYKHKKATITALNCAILCLGIIIFTALYTLGLSLFSSIGLTGIATAIVGTVICVACLIVFGVLKIIYCTLLGYIKWLTE